MLFVLSVQSSGDDEVVPDSPYLNITLPGKDEAVGEWAKGTVTGLAAEQLNKRIDEWAVQIPVTADDVFGTMYNGIGGLARDLAADTAKQTIGNARDGLLLDQNTSYTLDKTRLLDLTLNSLAQTSEAMLDFSPIAAFANMEVRAGVGSDQKPSYSLLTVQPLYEAEDSRHNVFAQGGLGYRFDNFRNRTTLNLGLGYRYLTPDEKWLYGTSFFHDHEFPYHHGRLGLGAEIESSLYRMGSNYYLGLSTWKDARANETDALEKYQERVLNGYDLEVAGRLPFFPELEIAVRGTRWDRLKGEKNIHELALRGEYTPVPAFSVRAEIRDDNTSKPSAEATAGLELNFGEPLADQFKPEKKEALLSVKARRFHVVERQNIIEAQEYGQGGYGIDFSMVPPMTTIAANGKSFVKGCQKTDPSLPYYDIYCVAQETPEHEITFDYDFEIGTYEVTWDDYQECIDDGGCTTVPADDTFGKESRPQTNVSWNDINDEYIVWLNSETGRTYRLPTESEWEYAARAGTTTAYPWGDDIGINNANCGGTSCGDPFDDKTAPVGSFAANAWGVYDMPGNVREWTQDKLAYYSLSLPTDGSAHTSSGNGRVLRGGSWSEIPNTVRSANRTFNLQSHSSTIVGFRLARTL